MRSVVNLIPLELSSRSPFEGRRWGAWGCVALVLCSRASSSAVGVAGAVALWSSGA